MNAGTLCSRKKGAGEKRAEEPLRRTASALEEADVAALKVNLEFCSHLCCISRRTGGERKSERDVVVLPLNLDWAERNTCRIFSRSQPLE